MNCRGLQCAFFLGFAALGCGPVSADGDELGAAEPGGAFAPAEYIDDVGTTSQALTNCRVGAGIIGKTWVQGELDKPLVSASTHICGLHRVQGKFEGFGEIVAVYVHPDGNWHINGASQQNGVAATAWCVDRACFARPQGEWFNGAYHVQSDIPPPRDCDLFAGHSTATTGQGDSTTIITGVGGKLIGRGESLAVFQNPDGGGLSKLIGSECSGSIDGYAYGYWAGFRNVPARFWNDFEFTVDSAFGPRNLTLAPANQAFCHLTHISGNFRGAGEWVDLSPDSNNVWQFRSQGLSSPSSQRPLARARCYLYNQ
jgi:hypothetical protein